MGRGCKEERQGQGEGQSRSSEQQRPHHDPCTGPGPAGAHPRGGLTGRGKGCQPSTQNAAPTYGQGPSNTHHREEWGCLGCGRYHWMTRLTCGDSRPLAPGVWTTEGGQKVAPGPPSPEQAAACAETLEKALASITEGGDPTVKQHLTDELAKAKQAAQDPRRKGARLDSAEAELRRHQQKMDSLTEQRAKLDDQIKECAESIRTAEDRLDEARQARSRSQAGQESPDHRTQLRGVHAHWQNAGTLWVSPAMRGPPRGGSSQGAPSLQREIHWAGKLFREKPTELSRSWAWQPTSPADSLPTRQEGARTPNTEDEAEAASVSQEGHLSSTCHPGV